MSIAKKVNAGAAFAIQTFIALLVVIFGALGSFLYRAQIGYDRIWIINETQERNDIRGRQLADAVAQQTEALIALFDMALAQLSDAYADDKTQFDAYAQRALRHFPAGSVNLIAVTDKLGDIVYVSNGVGVGTHLGDRKHFRRHQNDPTTDLIIDDPTLSRVINKWALPFSRAIRENGVFQGTVILSVSPEYLSRKIAALGLNESDVAAIIRSDGVILARNRKLEQALGATLPADRPFLTPGAADSGSQRLVSVIDNAPLNFAWKKFYNNTLISIVALDEREETGLVQSQVAQTLHQADIIAVSVSFFSLCIGGLLWRSARQTRRLRIGGERYDALMRTAGDGIHILDLRGDLVEAGDSFYKHLGYDPGAPPKLNVADWDRCFSQSELQATLKTLMSVDVQVFETRHLRADGTMVDVEISSRPIVLNGERFLYCSARDITGRKRAEGRLLESKKEFMEIAARLSRVLETIEEGILGINEKNNITFANAAAAKILGWPSAEAMQGVAIRDITRHLIADGIPCDKRTCKITMSLATRESARVTDEFFTHRSGRIIAVEYVVSPVVAADVTVGAVIAFHDITQQKAVEAELVRSNAELEQFAYVASHDLRQPLRTIISYLALAERRLGGILDAETKEYFDFAVHGAKRMDGLIVGLLEYSRIGRAAQPFEALPISEVVALSLLNLDFQINEAAAKIVVSPDLPQAAGDRTELMRLYQNLIGNALKYRAPDRPLEIEVGCGEKDGAHLLWVKDNGTGIDAKDFDRAFGIFQRLVHREQAEGAGIGLALCRKIVEHHGGRIWIESETDKGAAFYFTLPKIACVADDPSAGQPPPFSVAGPGGAG
jgi:PAS domain S-box-containing protein